MLAPRYHLRFSGPFNKVCEVFDGRFNVIVATFYTPYGHPAAERMVKRLNRV